MLEFLCTQPRYDTGDKGPAAPAAAPSVPGLLDGLGLSALWQAPTPQYDGQPVSAAASSPGLLCWLLGAPTPAYQPAAAPAQSSQTARQLRTNTTGR